MRMASTDFTAKSMKSGGTDWLKFALPELLNKFKIISQIGPGF
jgi:hypothetical protein